MLSDVYMAVEETDALKELDGNQISAAVIGEKPSESLKGRSKSEIGPLGV